MSNRNDPGTTDANVLGVRANSIPLWQILVIAGAFLILFIPILIELVKDWYTDDNYSHGFLIIPLSLYFVWRKREVLKSLPLESSRLGLPVIIASLALFIVGIAGAEYFSTRVAMVGLLIGMTLYLAGARFAKEIWFSYFLLLFMIPVPYIIYYSITFPLQLISSKVAAGFLTVLGIPHMRQGNIIHMPDNFSLEVAEACSGLRSLVTLLALGAVLGYLTQTAKWKGVLLFAATIPIAIVANIFRITVTAVGAYAISRKLADTFLHELSGTIVFVFSLISLFLLSSLLKMGEKKE